MKTLKEIITDWYNEAGLKQYTRETIAFHYCDGTLYIVTQTPEVMIGYRRRLIDKYRETLKENGYNCEINFIDIFCGYIKEF